MSWDWGRARVVVMMVRRVRRVVRAIVMGWLVAGIGWFGGIVDIGVKGN